MFQSGKAFLASCLERNLSEILNYLKQDVLANWQDEIGTTALQTCAASGWEEAVSILIKYGSNVDCSNCAGWTPLMHAARNGHSAVVQQLISAGSNAAALNCYGWDALSMAILSLDEKTVSTLVPLATSTQLNNALAISSQVGRTPSIQLLLDHHADVNSQLPYSGVTPLMLAASEGHKSVVDLLLSHGANPNVRNTMDLTALDVAMSCGHKNIQEALALVSKRRLNIPVFISPVAPLLFPCTPNNENSTFFRGQIIPLTPSHSGTKFEQSNVTNSPFIASQHHVCLTPVPSWNALTPNNGGPSFEFPSSVHSSSAQNFLFPSSATGTYLSSPLIPGWIFSLSAAPHHEKQSGNLSEASTFKSSYRIQKWWKKFKRRHIKEHNPGVREDKVFQVMDQQLEPLIKALKLNKLLPTLQAHEIDVQTFLSLSDKDLKELGISDNIFRAKVMKKINNLNVKYKKV